MEHSTCLDGDALVMSNTKGTAKKSSRRGFETAFCAMRQSSGTFENLSPADAPKRIAEWLTLSVQDFPASPFPSPAKSAEPMTSGICGPQQSNVFAVFAPDFSLARTSQGCLAVGISDEYSETWPRAGTMQNGACYRQPNWERAISVIAFGSLLPTPTTGRRAKGRGRIRWDEVGGSLARKMLRKFWPEETIKGHRNPVYEEWRMGWPINWTGLRPLEMDKFRSWQQQHGACSQTPGYEG